MDEVMGPEEAGGVRGDFSAMLSGVEEFLWNLSRGPSSGGGPAGGRPPASLCFLAKLNKLDRWALLWYWLARVWRTLGKSREGGVTVVF